MSRPAGPGTVFMQPVATYTRLRAYTTRIYEGVASERRPSKEPTSKKPTSKEPTSMKPTSEKPTSKEPKSPTSS